jgi:hypothetical protein
VDDGVQVQCGCRSCDLIVLHCILLPYPHSCYAMHPLQNKYAAALKQLKEYVVDAKKQWLEFEIIPVLGGHMFFHETAKMAKVAGLQVLMRKRVIYCYNP